MQKTKKKLEKLANVLDKCGTLLIVTHDYPDPDALASAMVLSYLVRKRYRKRTRIAYGGLITRAENRAMVKQLKIKLTHADKIRWNRYRCVAMVDTQPPFGNHSLPEEIKPTIVIDHHPKKEALQVDFEDIETETGASVILLLQYLKAAELELPVNLATAITYAIRSETQELSRDTTKNDINTYLDIYLKANKRKLARIYNPKLPKSYFVLLHRALQNAMVFRHLAHVHLGEVESPEFVSQVADILLRHERISWALATGRFDDELFISLRCGRPNSNAGNTLRQIVANLGVAGGHARIAGGQVPLNEHQDTSWEELEHQIIERFLQKLRYAKEAEWKPMLVRDET
ncbi:phosphoesterase [candidate division KSB1 bacterium]|nr:phosphoesterase [candidate division KSB1 bacterium]NIS24728.1 phosphoesterase [candidate division KSB1 bacterium]NIU25339.1 phosphoesterase [candidate division KSB1 bacterium]NIU89819.1 phosphoesterase [candidate division KSB1 bacterium]NIV94596.1 phosphoesterase [candidate division KSB1 bacterium]